MVRKHSPSTSRSVSEPCVAFSAVASASDTDSGQSLVLDVSSFWSAMKPNRLILSMQAQHRRDSLDVTELLSLSLKPAPLFNMLRMPSVPSPTSCPPLPVHCTHAVLTLVWEWAHSRAADLQTGHGLAAFGKSPPQIQHAAHVQGTLSSPALGLRSS